MVVAIGWTTRMWYRAPEPLLGAAMTGIVAAALLAWHLPAAPRNARVEVPGDEVPGEGVALLTIGVGLVVTCAAILFFL